MDPVKISDSGHFRKMGSAIAISCGLLFWSFAYQSGTPWYGYLYGPGMAAVFFSITRFRSEIEVSENEFRFTGYVWIKIRVVRIFFDSIIRIVEKEEGKGNATLAIIYKDQGRERKFKIYSKEFPGIMRVFKVIASKYPITIEEVAAHSS